MCGRIWSRTGWESAVCAKKPTARRAWQNARSCFFLKPIRTLLKPVRIIFRSRLDAPGHWPRRRLRGDDLPELRREVRLHVIRTGEKCRVARANYLILSVQRGDLLHPRQRDRRIERPERAQNRRFQRNLACLRVALRA